MRSRLDVLASFVALAITSGCGTPERFTCQSDVQCVTDMVQGRCEIEGVCSFPDLGCDSGLRFGDRAGELAGMCVGESGTGATSMGSGAVSSGADATSSGGELSGVGPDDLPPATTGPPPGEQPYGPCMGDIDCAYPGAICLPVGPTMVCAPPCRVPAEPSDECPSDPSMVGSPVCLDLGGGDIRCALSCLETMECPAGMACVPLENQAFCIWA